MNKGQLVEAVADQLGSRAAAEDAVDAVLDVMVRTVVAGERVQVTGFGTLEKVERAGRTARNPQTGERMRIKKTSVARFRPGQGFKDLVSGAKKMPKSGTAVAKAPKGSLTAGKTAAPGRKRTAAQRTTAEATTPAAAKKTTTRKTTAATKKSTAPAKKTATAAKKSGPGAAAKQTTPGKRATRRTGA
jgi:DNA-binding protein HU-beta